ncbi:GNAT family n-acetyltransferase [Paraphaeosphaeria minitans]|uniref:GNAT family n-acetyltransferase n=1 Tax=Paraphaeosphaeria minitans TaxID=565426 RepID=A0A9P6G805_9PLEO|nr:GNAT family n-acetyltransferase [Paraphaeosphaeria minitans]
MCWARWIAHDQMETMLDDSCTLGMHEASGAERRPIDMARMITDYVSSRCLTDVYVLKGFRGHGLGLGLGQC